MEQGYFKSDTYVTSEEDLKSWRNIYRRNRLYFTFKFANIVLRTRGEARKGIYDDRAWEESSFYILSFIEKSGGRFNISGMDNISGPANITGPEDPLLFIANHMSTLETMILPCIISPLKKVTFVVKESLVKHPLFGDVMRSRDPIIVGRTDPRKDLEAVMNEGMELLAKGISIIIFPQSTRNVVFNPSEFNSLGVKLAKKAGVKVVPVALKTDFWGNGKMIRELGPLDSRKTIYFRFGESFDVKGSGRDENQRIIDFIQSSLTEWQNSDTGK